MYIQKTSLSILFCLSTMSAPVMSHAQMKSTSPYDKDAEAITRIPPIMPQDARASGYCCMVYDVNETGIPVNIKANYCTEAIFKDPSKHSIQQWKYSPAIINEKPVLRSGVTTTLSFRLSGFFGQLIGGPTGYLMPRDIKTLEPAPRTSGNGLYKKWLEKNFQTETPCGDLIS